MTLVYSVEEPLVPSPFDPYLDFGRYRDDVREANGTLNRYSLVERGDDWWASERALIDAIGLLADSSNWPQVRTGIILEPQSDSETMAHFTTSTFGWTIQPSDRAVVALTAAGLLLPHEQLDAVRPTFPLQNLFCVLHDPARSTTLPERAIQSWVLHVLPGSSDTPRRLCGGSSQMTALSAMARRRTSACRAEFYCLVDVFQSRYWWITASSRQTPPATMR